MQEVLTPAHLLPVERADEMQVYVALGNELLHPGHLHLLQFIPKLQMEYGVQSGDPKIQSGGVRLISSCVFWRSDRLLRPQGF